jgi:hypothetical protein
VLYTGRLPGRWKRSVLLFRRIVLTSQWKILSVQAAKADTPAPAIRRQAGPSDSASFHCR